MTGRERMLEALAQGVSDGSPVVIPYVGIFLRDHWGDITGEPWWATQLSDIPALLRVEESLVERLDLDWVECGLSPPKAWRETHVVKGEAGRFFLVDLQTGSRQEIRKPPVGGEKSTWMERSTVRSEEDVYVHVPVEHHDKLVGDGSLDYLSAVVAKFGSERFITAHVGTPLWMAYHYLGFKGTLVSVVRNAGFVEYLLERLTLGLLERLRAYADVGVDGVWIEDCLCSASEISLTHFDRYVLPYVARLISEIRRLGMKSIYYFCGDAHDRLERLVQTRPDALSLEESKKGFEIDIAWVDEVVKGRTCIFGNLDAVDLLPNGSRQELQSEIERQLQVGRRSGKFVMSLGSPVTPGTSIARVREYVDLTRRLSVRA